VSLGWGRVVGRALAPEPSLRWPPGAVREVYGRVLRREVLAAEERARQLVEAAEQRADAIRRAAESAVASVRLGAEAEGRADAVAGVAARALALADLEARSVERQLDRVVDLARLLAERLVTDALELDPELVVARARALLAVARGARVAVIVAHPDDAAVLERSLPWVGVTTGAVTVKADPSRGRGSLRIETEAGVLDGDLAPQLERLALKLRESLGP
jgi:flagellar biosynthesis/type III secretory pathway protein FliH